MRVEKIPIKKNDYDPVNNPEHYTSGKYEPILIMEDVYGIEAVKNFCICNAFKYIFRFKKKNGLQDIKKARWYIDHYISLEEREDEPF